MDKDKDEKIKKLEDEVNILREKLKKYTNGDTPTEKKNETK